jgi:hypothetical protein
VDDADGVCGRESEEGPFEHGQGRLWRERRVPAQHVAERDTVDRLHDDRRALGRLGVLEEPGDMRIRHPGEHVDLVAEHGHVPRIGQQLRRQILDRYHLAVATRRATTTRPWAPLPQFVEFLEPC